VSPTDPIVKKWLYLAKDKKISVRQAAKNCGMPAETFRGWLKSPDGVPRRVGRPTTLSPPVEAAVAKKLLEMADAAVGLSPKQTSVFARRVVAAIDPKIDFKAGPKWRRFLLRRQPTLSERTGTKTTGARINAFCRTSWYAWCGVSFPIIRQYPPEALFNYDDSGGEIEHRKLKVSERRMTPPATRTH
jgi:hypothetical protein